MGPTKAEGLAPPKGAPARLPDRPTNVTGPGQTASRALARRLDSRDAVNCGRYSPGHLVHWIQWKKVMAEDDMVDARLVRADVSQDALFLEVEGATLKAWNHDVAALVEQVESAERVQYSPVWRVLMADRRLYCLATSPETWEPACATPATDEDLDAAGLLEHISEFGGVLARPSPRSASDDEYAIQERAGVRAAIEAVRLMTGLDDEDAAAVVLEGDHERYDGSREGWLEDPDEPLSVEVRQVVEDCLDEDSVAGAWPVAMLLAAMEGGLASVTGDTIELRLLDDRLVLIGENDWSGVEIRNDRHDIDLIPTGVDHDCPDPLTVARALARVAPRHPDSPGIRPQS